MSSDHSVPVAASPGAPPAPIDEVEASRAPLMDHLIELRSRLVKCSIAVVVLGLLGFFFSQYILDILLEPFSLAAHRAGRDASQAYFTAPLELLFLKLKLAMLIGIAGAFPYIAWHIWRFVAPGLYKNERGAVAPFIIAIPFLFAAGGAVVYFVLLPLVMGFAFGQEFTGESTKVTYLPKVAEYYSLAIALFTAFGMAFQLPVVLALLAKAEIISSATLRKGRKYAVVAIFAVAMVMTPPDVFSQTVLALPVYGLYEASIFCAWMIERDRRKREAAEAKAEAKEAAREAAKGPPRDAGTM